MHPRYTGASPPSGIFGIASFAVCLSFVYFSKKIFERKVKEQICKSSQNCCVKTNQKSALPPFYNVLDVRNSGKLMDVLLKYKEVIFYQ